MERARVRNMNLNLFSKARQDTDESPSLDVERDGKLFAPVLLAGRPFYVTVGILSAIVLWAVFAWLTQYSDGLGVTGLNRRVYWGFYITNFVFFIGISHAGTLISAILRLCHAEWRRAITRSAEVITVLVLFFGVGNVVIDLGRPDRALNVMQHGNFSSPMLWDVTSITMYLTASTIYLFLPLIPDIALVRDKLKEYAGLGRRVSRWRLESYTALSLGWTGSEKQQRRLDRAIAVMAVLVIPIAVSVHTVVSWVFAMTIQPMWRSTIFGPYLINPRLPYERGLYHPTWVEASITAGCFAMFILPYIVFTKLFPIVSIWEVREGEEKGVRETEERIKSYFPGVAATAD